MLSVVVPAFNESRRLPGALPQLLAAVDPAVTEILVVDDGSSDRTAEVAADLLRGVPNARVLRLPSNAGKGAAVRFGVSRARGSAVMFADADMAADPHGVPALLERLDRADVAIGSRAVAGSVVDNAPASRVVMGRAFNLYIRAATNLAVHDSQCGFKAFRGPVAKVLFHLSTLDGFAFDVELLLLASKLCFRVEEHPVNWTAVPGSHVQPVRDSFGMAVDVARSRVRWRGRKAVGAVRLLAESPEGEAIVGSVEALRGQLRRADSVVPWPGGALALLPCVDRASLVTVGSRVRRRLRQPGRVAVIEYPARALLHPATGLLRAALGTP